jgi:hypothetical protein
MRKSSAPSAKKVGFTQRQILWKEFQRNETFQLQVLRFVDNAHAAGAEFFANPVMRNGFADHGSWGADSRCTFGASQRTGRTGHARTGYAFYALPTPVLVSGDFSVKRNLWIRRCPIQQLSRLIKHRAAIHIDGLAGDGAGSFRA